MLTRLPDVQVRTDQRERKRQAVAADGFGQADDVRFDAGRLEAEEGASAAAAHLHVIDDEQQALPLA